MSRRLVLTLAAVALAASALGGLFWAAERFRPPAEALSLPLEGGGVTIAWAPTDDALAGPGQREPRDYMLESDRLRLVVASDGSSMQRHQRYGAVVDFGPIAGVSSELVELRSVLYVGGNQVPLRTLAIDVSKAGELPVLAVEESSRDGHFELRTEYRLEPGVDYVDVVTRVTNLSDRKLTGVQLGDRGRWAGATAFAPRLGPVRVATRADVPWIGRSDRGQSFGLVFLDQPAQASFQFDVVGPTGEITLGAAADLLPHATAQYRRALIAAQGGLGAVARIAWRRLGRQLGFARGVLVPQQTWARVTARHPDGHPVLTVPVDTDGRFELPLPVGEYRFVLQAPGGEDEELASIRPGAEARLNLVPPRPGTLAYDMRDEEQRLLPSRLVVRGVPPTKDPDLSSANGESTTKNILYSLTGTGSVQLPAGRYDVLSTHGPEYSLPRQLLELNADQGATFHAQFSRVVDTAGYLAADFHLHAAPSRDSTVPLTERVLTLAAEGVELAAATDHNHVTDYTEAIRAQRLHSQLGSMPGVEITTPSWGHFNAYPYDPGLELPPFQDGSPLEIFSLVRARAPQAVLQVNHPRMPGVGYFNRGELDTRTGNAESPEFSFEFDTLEVSNGFELEDPKILERNLRDWFELGNVGHRYTAVGNSDSHRLVFQWAGWPRTYVRVPDKDPSLVDAAEVARALKEGHALVSCGIFVLPTANGSAGPGDSVQASRVTLAISARAPEWIDVSRVQVYVNGAKVEERTRPPPRQSASWNLELDLELKLDSAVVVVARGDKFMNDVLPGKWIKPFGFSNPIFVDADGDGEFTPPGQ